MVWIGFPVDVDEALNHVSRHSYHTEVIHYLGIHQQPVRCHGESSSVDQIEHGPGELHSGVDDRPLREHDAEVATAVRLSDGAEVAPMELDYHVVEYLALIGLWEFNREVLLIVHRTHDETADMERVVRVHVLLTYLYLLPDLKLLCEGVIHDPSALHQFGQVISRDVVEHRCHWLASAVLQSQRDVQVGDVLTVLKHPEGQVGGLGHW